MSQLGKRSTVDSPAGKVPSTRGMNISAQRRRTSLIIASVVIALILVIVSVSYYFSEDARYHRLTIITVDGTSISMDYFLKRTQLAGGDPMSMLQPLSDELLIRVAAPKYVGEVSSEDIDQELRRIAKGQDETISESEFKEWYRQQLNKVNLSDSEYREIVATGLLTDRLQEYLAKRVPTVAEQVHLHAIAAGTYDEAEKVRIRLEAGETFADLAREVSAGTQYQENAGDLGWRPRGILPYGFDEIVFSLAIGDVSEPIPYEVTSMATTSSQIFYYLFMVSEKAEAREIDEEYLKVLQVKALDDWLVKEITFHKVEWHGLKNGFDSETDAWINYQLAKGKGKR